MPVISLTMRIVLIGVFAAHPKNATMPTNVNAPTGTSQLGNNTENTMPTAPPRAPPTTIAGPKMPPDPPDPTEKDVVSVFKKNTPTSNRKAAFSAPGAKCDV